MRPILALLAFLATPSLAFEVDLSDQAMRSRLSIFTVADLAVGETGVLSFPYFCSRGSSLYLLSDTEISTFDSSHVFTATREPNGTVSISAKAGARAIDAGLSDREAILALARTIVGVEGEVCENRDALAVTTINGSAALSDLLQR